MTVTTVDNFINGAYKPSSSANDYLPVVSPVDGATIGRVAV